MTEGFRHFLNVWDELRLEVGDYREVDDERILVLLRMSGRGKMSGLELDQITPVGRGGAGLFHVQHDKVKRYVIYWDHQDALADLGLAPEAESRFS